MPHEINASQEWQVKFENSHVLVKQLIRQNGQLVESLIRAQEESSSHQEILDKVTFYEEQIKVLSVTNQSLFMKLTKMTESQENAEKRINDLIVRTRKYETVIYDLDQSFKAGEKKHTADLRMVETKLDSSKNKIVQLESQVQGYQSSHAQLKLQVAKERNRFGTSTSAQLVTIQDFESSMKAAVCLISQKCREMATNNLNTLIVAHQLPEECGLKNVIKLKLQRMQSDVEVLETIESRFENLLPTNKRFCSTCWLGYDELRSKDPLEEKRVKCRCANMLLKAYSAFATCFVGYSLLSAYYTEPITCPKKPEIPCYIEWLENVAGFIKTVENDGVNNGSMEYQIQFNNNLWFAVVVIALAVYLVLRWIRLYIEKELNIRRTVNNNLVGVHESEIYNLAHLKL
ncbi:hypothetical protein HDE_06484 [Halotydeus destructor]|nr:hypothetical protein HDE_06484 [Halotydeus destructor]